MNKRIITLLIVAVFSISCLSMVSADNNTTNATDTVEIEDAASYIMPISITDNGIEFSDGFTGFCIDLSKTGISADDKFTSEATTDNENAIKLAIIECYKANKENDMENIISKVIDKDTSDEIAEKVLSSTEKIGDNAVVEISNDTEATFNFELLKSNDGEKSDCLAYSVSLKSIIPEDTLSAANDENSTTNDTDNDTAQTTDDANSSEEKTDDAPNKTDTEKTENIQNNTKTNTTEKTENVQNNTKTNTTKKTENVQNNTKTNTTEKTVTETNKTVLNKTNTVIVNEKNTTVINKNNTKIINKTKETPQNATVQDTIMRTVGNPIFLLVIVIIIVAVVAVAIRRKG